MNNTSSLDLKKLPKYLSSLLRRFSKYTVIFFLLLLLSIYGFVLYRVTVLSSAQPSDTDVSDQAQASATPHIDPKAVQQMQSLQDNSVRVQTLFNQARNNPFQE